MSVNRRRFLTALGAVLAAPLGVRAQQAGKMQRVGVISENSDTDRFLEAFRQGLRELGYSENQNIVIEYRYAQGAVDRVPAFAAELVRLNVDVLLVGGTQSARTAKAATTTVPIVFVTSGDPVASGVVTSLARPGGNATGLSIVAPEMMSKQLELLKTVTPQLSRVAILVNPANPPTKGSLHLTREAARILGVEIQLFEASRRNEVAIAFKAITGRHPGALILNSDPVFGNELAQIARLAAEHRLPAIYNRREFAEVGGLLAYGPSFADNYRRAATYIDKILKGTRPADLPIEQPSKFDLVINLKTATALGLTIPPSLLLRADHVIE